MILFSATIVTAVCFHNYLYLPPFLGMMRGHAYLQFFGYYLRKSHRPTHQDTEIIGDISHNSMQGNPFTSSGVWRVPSGTHCYFSMASYSAWVVWASPAIWGQYTFFGHLRWTPAILLGMPRVS